MPSSSPTPTQIQGEIPKTPPKKEREPEIQEYEGRTWKRCNKCFGGVWNLTYITAEHQRGQGQNNTHHPPPTNDTTTPPSTNPQVNITETTAPTANVANTSEFTLDFI